MKYTVLVLLFWKDKLQDKLFNKEIIMKVFTKEEVQKMAIENLNEDPERGYADITAIKD